MKSQNTKGNRPDLPLPANVDAERAILGAILLDNSLFEPVSTLEPEDFSLSSHRLIFLFIAEMLQGGDAVDIVTLVERLRADKQLDSIGDCPVAYIASLSEDTIRYRKSVRDWARIVKAKSLQRRLIACCQTAAQKAFDGESGRDIIAFLRENIDDIERAANRGMRPETVVTE